MSKCNPSFNLKIRYLAGAIPALWLSACGGNSWSPNSSSGSSTSNNLSFSITAPLEYPAGVSETVYMTITNTSKVNATGLSYTVPSHGSIGNSIGVDVDNISGCSTINAGASCTIEAFIESGANPGSFTVTASGNSSSSTLVNLVNKVKTSVGLNASFLASTTSNIALVNIPANVTPLYILPNNQTVILNSGSSTIVGVSVLVESGIPDFNTITLYDNGSPITPIDVFPSETGSVYLPNSVVTFYFALPATASDIQNITAVTNTCTTNCSNTAAINLAQSGTGVLSIAPSYVNLSPNYNSQIYTLTNTGQASISNISLPNLPEQFSISNNSCGSTLAESASCSYTITYLPNSNYASESFAIGYNNGISTQSNSFTINTIGVPYITFTVNGLGIGESIAAGESFTVTANLTESGNYNIPPQTIESANLLVNGLPVSTESFNFTPNSCIVSSNQESCTITVMVESTVTAESYMLTMQNASPDVPMLVNESIPFTVIASTPVQILHIFVTNGTHNGNFNGYGGADSFCQQDANNPESGSTYWKALLWGHNSTIAGRQYYNMSNQLIATANSGNLTGSTTGTVFSSPIASTNDHEWTGSGGSGATPGSDNCVGWQSSAGLAYGGVGNAGRTTNTQGFGWARSLISQCFHTMHLYCVEQPH